MGSAASIVTDDLGRLFDLSGDAVFAFLLSRCGSRSVAEDLTTETFLGAAQLFAAGRAREVTEAWLITVARRRLIDHWRREGARTRLGERLVVELERRPRHVSEAAIPVDDALDDLPPQYRAALVLRYLEGFSVSEVADALGKSYKATESVLARARTAFARAYESDEC